MPVIGCIRNGCRADKRLRHKIRAAGALMRSPMRAAISKFIGLMIFISAACAFADTKLPKCVIFTFGHCQGSLKYPNGDIYTGEFNYGQPNGVGKMTYANGDLYAGNFFEGQKHGIGDYTWADGNRYIGQFIGGNLEGRGAYYFLGKNKSNPDKYVGDFKKNAFNGDGIYTYGNGAVVSGKFKDGRKIYDLAAVDVAEAQIKTELNSGVNQTNKYQEKNAQDVTVTANKSNISKGKELLALANVSRQTEEKSSLATQLDSQAELDRSLRRELEIESAAAVIAQEKAQSIADENARLKSQIETQTELDRTLRLKLEAASADAVIANEMARSISDENAKLKRQIDSQVELDKSQKLKMETESVAALIAQEKAQSIADENARLKSKIETQAELDRNLRLKLEAESAVALIAKEKAQSIADENARLKSQIEIQAELDRKLLLKLEAKVAVAAIAQERKIPQGDERSTEYNKIEQDHSNDGKAKGSTVKNVGVSNDSDITLDKNNEPNESNFSRPQNKYTKNFFITGSLNLVDINASNFSDANGLFGKSKFGGAPKELPYSLGFGYNFAENYGLELSFKNHGSQMAVPALLDERIFKSSSILIGGFLEFPIDPKLSLGLKYGAHSTESTYSAKNYLYRIDNQDSFRDYDFVNKSINDYYGYSISYLINRQNKLSLNWIRLKSVFSVVGDSTIPYSTDVNTDVTEIAYKYNF